MAEEKKMQKKNRKRLIESLLKTLKEECVIQVNLQGLVERTLLFGPKEAKGMAKKHGKTISLDSKGFIKNIKFPKNNFKVKHIPHINMHKNKKVSEVLKSDTTTSAGIHGSCGLKEREAMQIREVYKAVLSVSTDSSGQPNEDMEKLSSNTNGFYFDIKVRKEQINDMGDQLYLSTCKMYRTVSPIPSPNCFSFKKYLQEVDELFYRCNYKLHEAAKEKWDQMEQAEFKKETYGKISELDRNLVFIAGGLE